MTDLTAKTGNQYAQDAGVAGTTLSKTHMGEIHVCNDNWEDCEGQERNASKKAKKVGPINATEGVNATNATERACPEFGPTVGGCECIDSCVCRTQTFCTTRAVVSDEPLFGGEASLSPCGAEVDWLGQPIDDCTYLTVPPVIPRFNYEPKPPENASNFSYYRAFGEEGNERHLPKKGCYSRKLFCVNFPRFPGCNPEISYSKYRLTDAQRKELSECNNITNATECEKHKVCGKGEHGTCHDDCLWGDDSPQWFRDLRRVQNVRIREEGDPSINRDGELLPVLQPGYAGTQGAGRLRNSNMGQKPIWMRPLTPDSGTSGRNKEKEKWPPPFFFPR